MSIQNGSKLAKMNTYVSPFMGLATAILLEPRMTNAAIKLASNATASLTTRKMLYTSDALFFIYQ
jgi:hypothetical protein